MRGSTRGQVHGSTYRRLQQCNIRYFEVTDTGVWQTDVLILWSEENNKCENPLIAGVPAIQYFSFFQEWKHRRSIYLIATHWDFFSLCQQSSIQPLDSTFHLLHSAPPPSAVGAAPIILTTIPIIHWGDSIPYNDSLLHLVIHH